MHLIRTALAKWVAAVAGGCLLLGLGLYGLLFGSPLLLISWTSEACETVRLGTGKETFVRKMEGLGANVLDDSLRTDGLDRDGTYEVTAVWSASFCYAFCEARFDSEGRLVGVVTSSFCD